MYYLDHAEVRLLSQDLLPRVRLNPPDERLRGWNWSQSPVKPYTRDIPLSVWEVAARTCPTNRDVWLRRKLLRKNMPSSLVMVKGVVIHRVVQALFKEARRSIYLGQLSDLRERLVEKGRAVTEDELGSFSRQVDTGQLADELRALSSEVSKYIATVIESHLLEARSKYPYIDEDSLASLVFPFAIELPIDGSLLGLSPNLRADASWIFGGLVYDIKTGERQWWHRLQIAGYALAIESFYERPVDIGAVIYVNYSSRTGGLRIEKDFFIVSDDLRSRFLEYRDELQMMLAGNKEPPVAEACPRWCLFREHCLGVGE
ncbi:type I-A CRISPR-associated protein Cas4/Csa1 [Desulfurococcus mucosus]|uniref:CRISPR-associated protein, Csa1 family n=1 Tax=Desulfurococcus mucosus (strain ATCC 35584 / DSM 2162 / JCM 9187 / O7/1) TaxID=765177 RepID=E8R9W6_DESM0|nr:type I-A CRISPR-associated protein Cas4/Csa1 [Desulfurococcus mucosus]ADV65292.1 CRISPR-associated protein, Csa1 family [Desulfurococcus mucosus DSM 2162]